MEIQHAGLGAAYLRAHPDVPAVHDLNEPCAYCAGNTFDLDAIRARDARGDFGPEDALQACIDRRDLLAEVDRLMDTLALVDDDRMFRAEQLQRAFPVIKAARLVVSFWDEAEPGDDGEWEQAEDALRAALAEYDRGGE